MHPVRKSMAATLIAFSLATLIATPALAGAHQNRVASELSTGTDWDLDLTEQARSQWNDYMSHLSAQEKWFVGDYAGGGSAHLNRHLNEGGWSPGDYLKPEERARQLKSLDEILSGRRTDREYIVTRGTNLRFSEQQFQNLTGKEIEHKGYMSTSVGPVPPKDFRDKNSILHLRVPKGVSAGYIESLSPSPEEKELLIARGSEIRVSRSFCGIRNPGGTCKQWQIFGEVEVR
ncbi:ADP-ribosyltransferase [Streptomyces sp. NPDC001941]|uniref:ADP-ribosyltransferase n=1 Tax=Streptomyces sp. NPDC001941 TaxID=3154659 RepID=UPI00331CE769